MELIPIYILIVVFGVVSLIMALYLLIKSKESQNWYPTEGQVLKSSIEEVFLGYGTMPPFLTKVKYSYVVEGKTYESTRIYWGDLLKNALWWRNDNILAKYRRGTPVTVFYNPLRPQESVLQVGLHRSVMSFATFSVVLIIVGAILLMN